MEAEKCVICGRHTGLFQKVCPACMKMAEQEQQETAQELRDIADVLSITANTDGNIQKSMEALLRIASRLERKKK